MRDQIWHHEIGFCYRPAGGSWSCEFLIGELENICRHCPSIAVHPDGKAYAVWQDWRDGNADIYFVGANAGAEVKVNDDAGTASQGCPSIAVDPDGNAYAVWGDRRSGSWDVYFAYRPAGGSWGTNVKVNDYPGTASEVMPSIAVDPDGNAYAVWGDERNGNADIYFANRPAGRSWRANVKVNDYPGTASEGTPSIAVDRDGNAYAVWRDVRNANGDIYFAYRPARGSWGANMKVNDDAGTADQGSPSIAVDPDGVACAVWEDWREGNRDIYFAYWQGPVPRAEQQFVPEPGTLLLLASGLMGLAGYAGLRLRRG